MPSTKKCLPVRETIMYPTLGVTPDTDPCLNVSLQFEHVLDCGHLITTPKPREPCAPNCHHVAKSRAIRKTAKMNLGSALSLDFYCDACVEVTNESQIEAALSCGEAEDKRAILRQKEANKRDKASKFRKCYVAQKITSVPCDEDGDVIDEYLWAAKGHPFDTALPRTGVNMFEDIDIPPPPRTRPRCKEPFGKAGTLTTLSDTEDSASDLSEEVAENINDTVAEGARWLREQEEFARRRQEEDTPSTRRRRASARPVIISSSPDTGMSSFVVSNPCPLAAQASPRNVVQLPQASKKRKTADKHSTSAASTNHVAKKKRKKTEKDMTGAPPTSQPRKRARATPNTPNTACAEVVAVNSATVPSAKKTKATAPQAAAKPSKKPSKRVCSVL